MALAAEGTSGRTRTGNGDAATAAARIVPALRPTLAASFEFFLPILIFTYMIVRNARVITVVPAEGVGGETAGSLLGWVDGAPGPLENATGWSTAMET
jgi:hypothetical protein